MRYFLGIARTANDTALTTFPPIYEGEHDSALAVGAIIAGQLAEHANMGGAFDITVEVRDA